MLSIVLRLTIIALLVYAGVTFWYGRVEERLQGELPAEQQEAVSVPAQEVEQTASTEDNYQIILNRNIFKAALESSDQSGEPSQADVDDLAETKLQLALLGTVTGDKDDARAIIRDERTKLEDLYQVGSEVQGAVIGRITRGKVVLQINGREEVLTIKDPEGEDQGQDAPRMATRAVDRSPSTPAAEVENKVPQAQPRRRISFRNTQPTPPAAENLPASAPEDEQAEMTETQPPPVDEAPLPEASEEEAAEQQGQ